MTEQNDGCKEVLPEEVTVTITLPKRVLEWWDESRAYSSGTVEEEIRGHLIDAYITDQDIAER